MSHKVNDMKITFLGVTPVLKDDTGYLKPQDIVALSALMTFKGKSVKDLYGETKEKGQDINKKVKTIIRKSSLRGHASIATTPAICFTYEASKFIDSLMTGMIFSSSLMASGRRTNSTIDDIMYPTAIGENKEAKEIYTKASDENINTLNYLLEEGVIKDEASKILHYGIYGTGIIAYPVESVIAFKKEIEAQGDWMPQEAKLMVEKIEKELKKYGVELIYASRELSGRNVLPYPNPFKDPKKSNMARELIDEKDLPKNLTKVVNFSATITKGLEKNAANILKAEKEISSDKDKIKTRWRELLQLRHEYARDYYNALQIKILSSVSWRVWGDKKRHRTVPMTVDSMYYSIDRCRPVFKHFRKKIADKKLTAADIAKIDRVFSMPPAISKNKEHLYRYLNTTLDAFDAYYTLIEKHDVKPSDAIYIIPRGVRLDLIQNYDLYNLIAGYFPLRTCITAEAQLRPMALIEMAKIKELLTKKGLKNLAKLIVTKCQIPHFCLEEKNCSMIKGRVKDYSEEYHEELKAQLDQEFEERLKEL